MDQKNDNQKKQRTFQKSWLLVLINYPCTHQNQPQVARLEKLYLF